jgi:subtilisin family serine protease
MRARRLLLIFMLVFGLASHASAASIPIIVELGPLDLLSPVLKLLNGTLVDQIPGTKIYLLNVQILPSALSIFQSLGGVEQWEVNYAVNQPGNARLAVFSVKPEAPADWYKNQPAMLRIRLPNALDHSTGRGVVVADINSRVDVGHPALIGHLTGGYDFVANKPKGETAMNQSSAGFMDQSSAGFMDQSSAVFMDEYSRGFVSPADLPGESSNPAYSHGTLCAGVIATVAPDSMIMPLRVFADDGSSDTYSVIKAIHYAVNNGAQIVNMSFGALERSPAMESAVDFARRRGVLIVASAGNNNTAAPQYPAAYDGVITVAATDLFDKKASFSNYGAYVYMIAPGVNIFSAYPGGYASVVSGTSFSAPVVAGTAALVRSLRTTGIAESLAGGSVNIDSNNPNYARQLGYGRIDVLRAVKPN